MKNLQKPIIAIASNKNSNTAIGIIIISCGKYNNLHKKILNFITKKKLIFPRIATLCSITIKNIIKENGIIIYYPKNKSYTGEHTIEIYLHGIIKNLNFIIKALIKQFKIYKISKAKKGDFTKKSLKNKKINNKYIYNLKKKFKKKNIKNKFANYIIKLYNIQTIKKRKYIDTNIKNILINFYKKINYVIKLIKNISIIIIGKNKTGKTTIKNTLNKILTTYKKHKKLKLHKKILLNKINFKLIKNIKNYNQKRKYLNKKNVILILIINKNLISKKIYYNQITLFNKTDLIKKKIKKNKKILFLSKFDIYSYIKLIKEINNKYKNIINKFRNIKIIYKIKKIIYKIINQNTIKKKLINKLYKYKKNKDIFNYLCIGK